MTAASMITAVISGGAAGTADAAQFTYQTQTRSVSATAGPGLPTATGTPNGANDNQSATAPDFAAFNASVSASRPADEFTMPPNVGAASQASELLPQGVRMSGRVSGADYGGGAGSGGGAGYSSLNTTFVLDAAADYTFKLDITQVTRTGSVGTTNFPNLYSASLTGPNGTVFTSTQSVISTELHPAFAGSLPSGSYTLDVFFRNGGGGFASSSGANTFSAVLSIPEPASVAWVGTGLSAFMTRRRRAG